MSPSTTKLSSRLALAAFLGLAALPSVIGFQEAAGPSCSAPGTPCSYSYTSGNGNSVQVNAFCAPNGFCGDNGATCQADSNCYNYCGSDKLCGGTGAMCNTDAPFQHNQFGVACYTPSHACNLSTGFCRLAAMTPSQASRRMKRELEASKARLGDSLHAVKGNKAPTPAHFRTKAHNSSDKSIPARGGEKHGSVAGGLDKRDGEHAAEHMGPRVGSEKATFGGPNRAYVAASRDSQTMMDKSEARRTEAASSRGGRLTQTEEGTGARVI